MIATVVVACLLNLAVTPKVIRAAHLHGWYDLPNGRKIHTAPIPRLGGIGMFGSFIVSILVVPPLVALVGGGNAAFPFELRHLPVLAALCLAFGIGLVDDFKNLRARNKFFLQIAAAILVMMGGFTISVIHLPGAGTISLGILAYPVTLLWIVGLTNAMNLVDGADGFAGSIAAFAALVLGGIAFVQGHYVTMLVSIALIGSLLPFLSSNFPPARIFMGDSGAYFLGFSLSVLPLLSLSETNSFGNLAATATMLAIPILDTFSAITRRVGQRRSIGTPDKQHVHHRLLDIGVRDRMLPVIAAISSLCLGAVSLGAALVNGLAGFLIFISAWAACVVVFFILKRVAARHSPVAFAGGDIASRAARAATTGTMPFTRPE